PVHMKRAIQAVSVFAAVWVTCLTASAFAQKANSLTGRIIDGQSAAVVGATVTLYSRETNVRTTTVTDSIGNYRFERVLAGDYVIEASSRGFGRASKMIRVEKDSPVVLDFALEIDGPSETVLVTAAGTPQTIDEVSK